MLEFRFYVLKMKTIIIWLAIIFIVIFGLKILVNKLSLFSSNDQGVLSPLQSVGKELKGDINVIINTYNKRLVVYVDGEVQKNYPVAIGKSTTKTPVGEWAIISKSKNWGGGFGTRWLGLNVPWGIYGIHGTNKPGSIGRAASHGCIRMHNKHVEELYELIPRKTRVEIIGKRLPIDVNYELSPGQTGLAVMQLQDNLKKYNFEPSYMDARYGPSTVSAIVELETQFGFKNDGRADWNVLYLLNLPK
jgi:murein L,D-transpeptidase YcbB/YkuD